MIRNYNSITSITSAIFVWSYKMMMKELLKCMLFLFFSITILTILWLVRMSYKIKTKHTRQWCYVLIQMEKAEVLWRETKTSMVFLGVRMVTTLLIRVKVPKTVCIYVIGTLFTCEIYIYIYTSGSVLITCICELTSFDDTSFLSVSRKLHHKEDINLALVSQEGSRKAHAVDRLCIGSIAHSIQSIIFTTLCKLVNNRRRILYWGCFETKANRWLITA